MKKNVSGQKVGAQMVSATDGSAFTGSVTVSVTVDAGTQATGSVGSGACTHEGNGYHTYAPAQAETNGDLIAFTFTGTGAVPATVQVYTVPTTGLLAPSTADRTIAVEADGMVYADAREWLGTAITAGSIPAAVAGASGGLVIAGSNAPITFTGSGNAFSCISTGGNGAGMVITGNGSGKGIDLNAGSTGIGLDIASGTNADAVYIAGNGTGYGVNIAAGSSGGVGLNVSSAAGHSVLFAGGTNSNGLRITSSGSGNTVDISQGGTGIGLRVTGGSTSGDGIRVSTTNGHALVLDATGASKYGLDIDTITASGAMTITGGITANITGNLTGNVTGSVGSVTGAVGSVTGNVGGNVTGSVGSVAADGITASSIATGAIDADSIAADAVDKLWDEAMTELSAVPGVTASLRDALRWLFIVSRNKITQTSTTQTLRNDADSATIAASTLSDDGTTFTRGEFA